MPLFRAYIYRDCVFSIKACFGGVMNLHSLRNFEFVFVLFCKKKNQRKDVREVRIKNNFLSYRYIH